MSDEDLKKAAETLVTEIKKIDDLDERRRTYERLFREIIYAAYDEAKKTGDANKVNKVKALVKPILSAYPNKNESMFTNNLEEYGLTEADLA